MEIREWALGILTQGSLQDKLFAPVALTDDAPGEPILIEEPARSYDLRFQRKKKEEKLPKFHDMRESENRAVCLHRFAGHELLAVEIMAFTLLAFPNAPKNFRKGVANTLIEEQEHVRLYCHHLERLGGTFGSLPLYRHFWKHTPSMTTPLHYVSTMSLTLEMANLDFAPSYGGAFEKAGDEESAHLMAKILTDEISHVRFGLQWLRRMKQKELSDWEAWKKTIETTLLIPKRAKGQLFHEDTRRKAGVDEEWIQQLKQAR